MRVVSWLTRLAKKSLINEIRSWGWAEDQLRMDAVQIHKQDNKFFISIGDWAEVDIDDLKGAIGQVYPGSEVDWDFEAGPPKGDWARIF